VQGAHLPPSFPAGGTGSMPAPLYGTASYQQPCWLAPPKQCLRATLALSFSLGGLDFTGQGVSKFGGNGNAEALALVGLEHE
jgi:hypothetical protein